MKAAIFAALLAAAPVGQVYIDTAGGVFIVQTETVYSYENKDGYVQTEAMVHLSTAGGTLTHRVGVAGCKDGRGQIARVTEDGTPAATPIDWRAGGTKVHDVLARTICAAARRNGSDKNHKGMV